MPVRASPANSATRASRGAAGSPTEGRTGAPTVGTKAAIFCDCTMIESFIPVPFNLATTLPAWVCATVRSVDATASKAAPLASSVEDFTASAEVIRLSALVLTVSSDDSLLVMLARLIAS